jgi:hypothetical protein
MNRSEQIEVLETFRKTLRQELHNLRERPEILWQQMYNRLQRVDDESGVVSKVMLPEFKKRTSLGANPWMEDELRKKIQNYIAFIRSKPLTVK